MNKILIAASAALMALAPTAVQASSVRTTVVATPAVSFCAYQLGYQTLEQAANEGAEYLDDEGISVNTSNAIMNSPGFNQEVFDAIEVGGGCEWITK